MVILYWDGYRLTIAKFYVIIIITVPTTAGVSAMVKVERVWPELAPGNEITHLGPHFRVTPDDVVFTIDVILANLANLPQLNTLDNGDGTIIVTATEACEPNVPELTAAIT